MNLYFQITFDLTATTKALSFTDTSVYSSGSYIPANMSVIIRVVDGSGTVIYSNGGYDSNDFSNPDFTGNGTKTGIPLQVDAADDPVTGVYYFYMKSKDSVSGDVLTASNSHNYTYESPTVAITQSADCLTSELTSTDSTSYTVNSISPTKTISHTVAEPEGSGADNPGTTTDVTRIIGGGSTDATRLWTGDWTTIILTALSYVMETWNGSSYIIITDSVTGNQKITVRCTNCIATLQTCISALYDRWVAALTTNFSESKRLGNIVMQVLSLVQEHNEAMKEGEDYSSIAAEIGTLLNSEGYTCSVDDDTSVVVVPQSQATTTATGSKITFVTSTPTGGNSGDLAIGDPGSSIAWNVYYNNGGTWVFQGNMQSNANQLLKSDFTDNLNTAVTTLETLKTYVFPASTLITDMGYLEIEALFYVADGISADLYLIFGSSEVATYTSTETETGYILLKGRIFKDGSGEVYDSSVVVKGNPDSEIEYKTGTMAETLTSNVTISLKCQKSAIGSIGDIAAKNLNVKISQ